MESGTLRNTRLYSDRNVSLSDDWHAHVVRIFNYSISSIIAFMLRIESIGGPHMHRSVAVSSLGCATDIDCTYYV